MNILVKIIKVLFIILGIIVGIFILPEIVYYYDKAKLYLTKEDLPEKYRNITTLDSLKDDVYEAIPFRSIRDVQQLENGNVIFENFTSSTIYKVDLKGKILDSLKFKADYFNRNDTLINLEKGIYTLWSVSGKKEFNKIEGIIDKIYSEKEVGKLFSEYEIIDFTNAFYIRDGKKHLETDRTDIEKLTIRYDILNLDKPVNDNKEYYLYKLLLKKGNNLKYIYIDYFYEKDRKNISKYKLEEISDNDIKIILHKTYTYIDDYTAVPFLIRVKKGGHMLYSYYYTGYNYYQLKMPRKFIEFKEKTYFDLNNENEAEKMKSFSIYAPKNAEYILFADVRGDGYLIRPKK